MTHDPLCLKIANHGNTAYCYCDLIADDARARGEQIAQAIEADHATGPLCKAFGSGANVCTHGRDAAIARGESNG